MDETQALAAWYVDHKHRTSYGGLKEMEATP